MRVLAFITFVIALPAGTFAQTADNPWFVRTGLMSGAILPMSPLVVAPSTAPVAWGPSVTIEIGRRTDGTRPWHAMYGRPEYGVGLSVSSFSSGAQSVRPHEAYGFFSWPFVSLTDRMDVTTDFGLGASWGWQSALGSNLNARIDWGFYLRTALTPRTVLYTGADFTHRSNGGLVEPNLGVNVLGPKVMMQYNFDASVDDVKASRGVKRPDGFRPSVDIVFSAAGGAKNVILTNTPLVRSDFGAFDATAGFARQFYQFGRVVGGATAMYDGASPSRMSLGTYSGYEHVIGRFAAGFQLGYKVLRGPGDSQKSPVYQRYGLSYAMSDRVFSTFAIRATAGRKADALEVGFGYRIPRR